MAAADTSEAPVLKVENLRTYFRTRWGEVKAVDGVSFELRKGETLGIVGESGSGKSVTMLSMMRLIPIPPGRIVEGSITLDGEDLLQLSESEMSKVRGSKIALIIQDPMTSLNPVFSIGNQVTEAIRIHQDIPKRSVMEKALEVLRKVNIPAAESRVRDYPHQMSGGMRQRVVGAIGISCQPLVLIADEPTTSLDVTIQAQYLKLLRDLQQESDMSLIFITHDFGIVAKMCDRVAVMYAGRIVELGSVRDIFNKPSHPYTQALINSVPQMDRTDRLFSIDGQPPALWDLPEGCRFAERCEHARPQCRQEYPGVLPAGEDHVASCWMLDQSWSNSEQEVTA